MTVGTGVWGWSVGVASQSHGRGGACGCAYPTGGGRGPAGAAAAVLSAVLALVLAVGPLFTTGFRGMARLFQVFPGTRVRFSVVCLGVEKLVLGAPSAPVGLLWASASRLPRV